MQLFSIICVLWLQGTIDFPPKLLLNELFNKVENIPNWNLSILETRTVQVSMSLLNRYITELKMILDKCKNEWSIFTRAPETQLTALPT
jgi:hypothetical protein